MDLREEDFLGQDIRGDKEQPAGRGVCLFFVDFKELAYTLYRLLGFTIIFICVGNVL